MHTPHAHKGVDALTPAVVQCLPCPDTVGIVFLPEHQGRSFRTSTFLLQNIKAEMDRVGLEIQNAERDYDLNHAAELKYGTLMQLQKQLSEAETALEAQVSFFGKIPGMLFKKVRRHAVAKRSCQKPGHASRCRCVPRSAAWCP